MKRAKTTATKSTPPPAATPPTVAPASDQPPLWLTVKELANRWRLSPSQIRRMCDRKDFPAKKFGDQWRIHITAIEAFEADGMPQPKPAVLKPDLSRFENCKQYV